MVNNIAMTSSVPSKSSNAAAIEFTVDEPRLHALLEAILAEARSAGASAAEAAVSVDAGLTVNVRLGEAETLEYQRDRGLGVTVYFGQSKASASTADLSDEAVRETVRKACSIARYTAEDPYAGLADAALMHSPENGPELDLFHPWQIGTDDAIEMALRCETAAREADERICNSEGAAVSTHQGVRAYGNSHGFIGIHRSSRHSISCSVLGEHEGNMERDYWFSTARDGNELQSPEQIGLEAARRTVRRLGGRQISTRKAPVLFPAELARGLIGHFLSAVRGGSQYRESSFLLGAQGSQVFPSFMQIDEDPHIPRGLASAAFDSEGVSTRQRQLVSDGVVNGYILGSYSARKLGLATTANAGGTWNMLVKAGGLDGPQLLREMGTGLLLTDLIGRGVNAVTGDYSRGAAGFWMEDGQIAYPVNEITIAGNLKQMYRQIAHVGTDVDLRGGVRCGSILVEQMTIAGE